MMGREIFAMGMLFGEVAAEQQSTMEPWLEELARRRTQ
jgi:hypothetical protein